MSIETSIDALTTQTTNLLDTCVTLVEDNTTLIQASAASQDQVAIAAQQFDATIDKVNNGLNFVDNTYDIDKPVSSEVQLLLNDKVSTVGYVHTDNNFSDADVISLAGKQETLENQINIKAINGISILGSGSLELVTGSAGYAANLYFTDIDSVDHPTYKQTSYALDSYETILQGVVSNGSEVMLQQYVYDQDVDTEIMAAGEWGLHLHRFVSDNSGVTTLRFELFTIDYAGVETFRFSTTTDDINDLVDTKKTLLISKNLFSMEKTDRLGTRIFATSNHTRDITVSLVIGSESASYVVTPLEVRHNQLRGRDKLFSHPIAAITDLQTTLDSKIPKVSSTDTAIAVFDGIEGNIKDSIVTVSATGLVDGRDLAVDGTKLDSVESFAQTNAANTVIDSAYVHTDNNFTSILKNAVTLNKLKDLTLDAPNNKVVVTYTDNTQVLLDINDVINDIYVSGAVLDGTSNVLTLSSSDGGADVTVDLSIFVNDNELANALNSYLTTAQSNLTYEPIDSTILKDADIGNTVQGIAVPNSIIIAPIEPWVLNPNGIGGANNIDVVTSNKYYWVGIASNNFQLNIRGNSSTSFNSLLATGDSIEVTALVTNSAIAPNLTGFSIDGVDTDILWSGGSDNSTGTANSSDAHVFTIIKINNSAYTVLGTLSAHNTNSSGSAI